MQTWKFKTKVIKKGKKKKSSHAIPKYPSAAGRFE